MASDAEKPDGFVELSAEEARERFGGASPGLVPGIGPKTVERLERLGITTLGALARPPTPRDGMVRPAARAPPGRAGALRGRARARDGQVAKSESRETTFDHDLRGLAALEPVLRKLTGELCEGLADAERRGRTVGIKVRFDDFSTVTRAHTLDAAVNDFESVHEAALTLLRRLDPPRPVRLLGVRVAGLDATEAVRVPVSRDQLSLAF